MKKVVIMLFVSSAFLFESCYAYLKAEKMVYSGTVAKKQPTFTIESDSTFVNYATE